jgi:hypothetical protein
MENYGPAYNFEKNSVNTRPSYVKSYVAKVKSLCKKGLSRKNAEKEADAQLGSVKEWVASERIEGRSGDIYRGSPPSTSVTTSPRLSTAPATRPGSPYSLNSNNRRSRRARRARSPSSKKSKKSKKT